MRTVSPNAACPCESGKIYRECCLRYIGSKTPAPTPEALMRSRFSAYATGSAEYLYYTAHPDSQTRKTSPYPIYALATQQYCRDAEYIHLIVLDAPAATSNEGFVTFIADYTYKGKAEQQAEISRFLKVGGRWLYIDGKPF